MGATLCALPDKRNRLAAFVETVRRQLAQDALLVCARCDKRRAALHAILAQFAESPAGWWMKLQVLDISLRSGRVPELRLGTMPVRITGHALERVFQRTRTTDWRAVIAELEPAAVMMGWLYPSLRSMGFVQAAVQTRSGLLLGDVGPDGVVVFKTFLRADEEDQSRLVELRRALWGFWIRNGGGRLLGEALFGSETQARLEQEAGELLAAHPWMACRHLAGAHLEAERWKLALEACPGSGIAA